MKNEHGKNGSISPADQKALLGVTEEFYDERLRAATDLGYDPDHDDALTPAMMMEWARMYQVRAKADLASWPSDQRVSEARDNLVKAGALIAATITRLDREASRG